VSLERPIHYSESVVDVAMRWARWPEEFRHGNCLTVIVYGTVSFSVCGTVSCVVRASDTLLGVRGRRSDALGSLAGGIPTWKLFDCDCVWHCVILCVWHCVVCR